MSDFVEVFLEAVDEFVQAAGDHFFHRHVIEFSAEPSQALFGGVAVQSGVEGGTQSEHGGDGEQDVESDDFPEKFGAQPGQAGAFCVGWAEPFGLAGRDG